MNAAFKGVLWPGRRVELPDGTTGYLTTIVGAFVTSIPPFERDSEIVLAGTSDELVHVLDGIARGHAAFKLGDASSVLTLLDPGIKRGPPRSSCDCNRCGQLPQEDQ